MGVRGAISSNSTSPRILAATYHSGEASKKFVDIAIDVSGGAGMFKSNELERSRRDVRCGGCRALNAARRIGEEWVRSRAPDPLFSDTLTGSQSGP
jgi:alkylation response protein AidB-like acyl-CoA dehydrogenase